MYFTYYFMLINQESGSRSYNVYSNINTIQWKAEATTVKVLSTNTPPNISTALTRHIKTETTISR